jgi:hypothetical protein
MPYPRCTQAALRRIAAIGVLCVPAALTAVVALPLGAGAPAAVWHSSSTIGCAEDHTAIDTVGADSLTPVFNGRGQGEVVALSETLVTAFTVYRYPHADSLPFFARLFVTDVDSTGKPEITSVEYAGPLLSMPFGDGLHPVPFKFSIDPPLALPRRGMYFFDVCEENCFGFTWLLMDSRNPYPQGAKWQTVAVACDPSHPGPLAQPFYSGLDLAFDVSTCASSTPLRRWSWGELKIRYH